MYAFSRQEHTANREVLIEKSGNINSIEEYRIERYDTVEVTFYINRRYRKVGRQTKFKKVQGFVGGFGYRLDKKGRTIGYCNVCLHRGKLLSQIELNISDSRELNAEGKHINMYPIRMVLIEKNFIESNERSEEEFRKYMRDNGLGQIIVGG